MRDTRGTTGRGWRKTKGVFEGISGKKWNIKDIRNQGKDIEESKEIETLACEA